MILIKSIIDRFFRFEMEQIKIEKVQIKCESKLLPRITLKLGLCG